MMNAPRKIAAALAGTPLAGLPVGHGPRGTIMIQDIDTGSLLDSWRAAHALLPVTGRWPVLASDDLGDLQDFEPYRDPDTPTKRELTDLERIARMIDPWPHFFRGRTDEPVTADLVPFFAKGSFSTVNLHEEVQANVPPTANQATLERWIYDRVRSDPTLTAEVVDGFARKAVSTDVWFTPANVVMLLLPTASGWLAPNWSSFFDALGYEDELAAALWQWQDQCDARLVANWFTMLQFVVHRPPKRGDQAWTLAGQIKAIAKNLGAHRWELATVLPHGDAWFIHSRP
jgi:hypothetical protein